MVGHSGERFDREMKSIHHLGEDWLVTLENVFDREMKSIHHFREDWLFFGWLLGGHLYPGGAGGGWMVLEGRFVRVAGPSPY